MAKRRLAADRALQRGLRNRVRIVGGEHRGRLLEFTPLPGLRPTPDRVRETLFNWLQPILPGAACLDLFAGSGILGLEAASRGAARVLLIDHSPEAVARIGGNIGSLGLARVGVTQADALTWLRGPSQPFDVVFLDPPYAADLLAESCRLLGQGGWLAADARIYLETDRNSPLPPLPPGWRVIRQKKAGQVCYYLCLSQSGAGSEPTQPGPTENYHLT